MYSIPIVPAVIMDGPQTQNITTGQSFMLRCNSTGYPIPNVEWRQNGTSYTIRDPSVITITQTDGLRSNSSVITATNAIASDTGLYQCVATNDITTDTENATVIVQSLLNLFACLSYHVIYCNIYLFQFKQLLSFHYNMRLHLNITQFTD